MNEVIDRTGGVAREVNSFLIIAGGDVNKYDRDATQYYINKFKWLVISVEKKDISDKLRASFSIMMAGLYMNFPVKIVSISREWIDAGIIITSDDNLYAKFVCPAQKRAVDQIYFNPSKQALEQAIAFLVNKLIINN